MKKYHVSTSIDELLKLTDKQLSVMFESDPAGTRNQLQGLKKMGHKLIPSANCEGFDPINGCPGHDMN